MSASRKSNTVNAIVEAAVAKPALKVITAPVKVSTTQFVIEKKIPLPAKKQKAKPFHSKYPFQRMAVGDSFLVTNAKLSTVCATVHIWNKRIRKANNQFAKFIARQIDNDVRVWRKN